MRKAIFAVSPVLILLLAPAWGKLLAATSKPTPILSGPLAKSDIKDAVIETARGKSTGKLTIAQHFALDPGWLDPDRKSTRLNSSHSRASRMPSSA